MKRTICFVLAGVLLALAAGAEAAKSRLDNATVERARVLAEDREAVVHNEAHMTMEEFKAQWSIFAQRVDSLYAKEEVRLKSMGAVQQQRQIMSYVLLTALKVQIQLATEDSSLTPKPQDLVTRHSFLQALTIDGSFYGDNPFPTKMKDALDDNPAAILLLKSGLETWDPKIRAEFLKLFPNE